MLEIIFWVFVGMIIGWHVPQPVWVKWALNKLRTKAEETIDNVKENLDKK